MVGACAALNRDDYMTGTHRSHGHPIAKGADVGMLMAELMGKSTGVCKGKGGPLHLADFSTGVLGEGGIVASNLPVATGAALSAQLQGDGRVALAFFGDGAVTEGVFHETLNLAAIWKLPIIYLCENNQYSVTTPIHESLACDSIAGMASAYATPGVAVDGQDAIEVYDVVSESVARARGGDGPSLIEAVTYRFDEHVHGPKLASYRSDDEIEDWRRRDPIVLLTETMLAEGSMTEDDVAGLEAEAAALIETAIEFARESPDPAPESAYEDLYAMPIGDSRVERVARAHLYTRDRRSPAGGDAARRHCADHGCRHTGGPARHR